jgi:hypothetical protein
VNHKIYARKFGGDDAFSWAVFLDGKPTVSGLTREDLPHYKKIVADEVAKVDSEHQRRLAPDNAPTT